MIYGIWYPNYRYDVYHYRARQIALLYYTYIYTEMSYSYILAR